MGVAEDGADKDQAGASLLHAAALFRDGEQDPRGQSVGVRQPVRLHEGPGEREQVVALTMLGFG